MAHYWVYVIELDADGLGDVGTGAVYVGETSRTPEERFAKHKAGGQVASTIVARRGLRLRPDQAPDEGPFATKQESLRWERRTANRLRHRGYKVWGGQGKPFMKQPAATEENDDK